MEHFFDSNIKCANPQCTTVNDNLKVLENEYLADILNIKNFVPFYKEPMNSSLLRGSRLDEHCGHCSFVVSYSCCFFCKEKYAAENAPTGTKVYEYNGKKFFLSYNSINIYIGTVVDVLDEQGNHTPRLWCTTCKN
jgi:hypothetical protein